jgi:hypothetical protein
VQIEWERAPFADFFDVVKNTEVVVAIDVEKVYLMGY